MKNLETLFKAFGNVSRLKILAYLKAHPDSSVEDIAQATKCSYKATSKHLAILFSRDLLDREQSGYEMHYRIAIAKSDPAHTLLELV